MFQRAGRILEAENANRRLVDLSPQDAEAHNNLGVTLGKLGRLDEAKASYLKALVLRSDYAEAHNNLGVTLGKLGKFKEAEVSYSKAIMIKPGYAGAHNNLGNILKELGKLSEAEASYKKTIMLAPDYAEAHFNLGNTLTELGRRNEAVESYEQAVLLIPNYPEAYYNLGNTLKELGRRSEAAKNYKKAVLLKPDYAEAYNNLGITLIELNRTNEALSACVQALILKPDLWEATVNLGIAISNVSFSSSNTTLYPILSKLLTTGNFARPHSVAPGILSLLKQDPLIKELLIRRNTIQSVKAITSTLETINKIPLLHNLMRVSAIPDLEIEELFVEIRGALLRNLDNLKETQTIVYYLSTLALQCFTNEYIYLESDEESRQIGVLETKIRDTLAQEKQPKLLNILILAVYRPLHHFDWCERLEVPEELAELKERLIEQPLLEAQIKNKIPIVGEISDEVSLLVKSQYEENPYPRWVKLSIPTNKVSIDDFFGSINLKLYYEYTTDFSTPEILIAGCGTGQQSIEVATQFKSCYVTAIDLSLTSLAYAQRKTNELGIENLSYLQADILSLYRVDKEFDMIQSSGVLHHMDNPVMGWKALTNLLRPGGFMKIALYSELARAHIASIREEIASRKVGTSAREIQRFRQLLINSDREDYQQLKLLGDFYNLSEFRDLIFHVQEHRFTIPHIQECLDELGLHFCGFENKNIVSAYRDFHGHGADIYDLTLWHKFEVKNPRTFIGMYQFWCQKMI